MSFFSRRINVRYFAIACEAKRFTISLLIAINDLSIVSQTVVYTKQLERREGIVELAVSLTSTLNFKVNVVGRRKWDREDNIDVLQYFSSILR